MDASRDAFVTPGGIAVPAVVGGRRLVRTVEADTSVSAGVLGPA